MAATFIGKPISLISHSDVRYRGILAGIDPAASTIQLSNVYSMGTESRRPPEQFIPPVQEPYAYIIFRASEVKDLAVDDPAPTRNVHDDPAVLGASAPMLNNNGYPPYAQPFQQPPAGPTVAQSQSAQAAQSRQPNYTASQQPTQPSASASQQRAASSAQQASQGTAGAGSPTAGGRNGRNNSVHSATASLETVERALGDLRVSSTTANGAPAGRSGGGRRGRHQELKAGDLRVPTTDFDFQSSNARFDKAALGPSPRGTPKLGSDENGTAEKEEAKDGAGKEKGGEKDTSSESAYNPKKSFFDSLSSGSNGPAADTRGGRGGGRRGGGRNRREEERERNVATFGEPGGVGLMGPGAYVGGWGGYGRRGGGGRGRRGAAAGAAVGAR